MFAPPFQLAASHWLQKKISPTFMQTLPVYDVANKRWYDTMFDVQYHQLC